MNESDPIAALAPPIFRPAPARRITSATHIFEALRTEIVALRLPPGTALQDRPLVERFQVSRTPVREALIRLAELGLVDIFPQAGTFVSRIPVNAIPEAVLIRKALEGITVERAVLAARPELLGPLDLTIRRQQAAALVSDNDAFHEADEAFHAALAELAGHPGIWAVASQAKLQIDRARRLTLPVLGRMNHVIGEHLTIRQCVAANDLDGARAAMTRHLDAVVFDIDELRGRFPTYFV